MAAPKRELFKAAEVCEMAQVQPYVLRSWEAEFPQLGHAPSGGGPRVYRRVDVELALRIKQLVFGEGLTLAGARRRLEEAADENDGAAAVMEEVLGARARERIRAVRMGLLSILQMLGNGARGVPARRRGDAELLLVPPSEAAKGKKTAKAARRR